MFDPLLMKLFQSLLHYLIKCMAVNQTCVCPDSCKLDISGENPCSASSSFVCKDILPVLNHVGTASALLAYDEHD